MYYTNHEQLKICEKIILLNSPHRLRLAHFTVALIRCLIACSNISSIIISTINFFILCINKGEGGPTLQNTFIAFFSSLWSMVSPSFYRIKKFQLYLKLQLEIKKHVFEKITFIKVRPLHTFRCKLKNGIGYNFGYSWNFYIQ